LCLGRAQTRFQRHLAFHQSALAARLLERGQRGFEACDLAGLILRLCLEGSNFRLEGGTVASFLHESGLWHS
jgi:hypothetical protein